MKKFIKGFIRLFSYSIISLLFLITVPVVLIRLRANQRTYTHSNAPSAPVAIVFGAGLRRDGTPTTVLQDRVATAADLYFSGKIEKILVSGDNRFVDYDEPTAMYEYARTLGVPAEAITRDYAGRRTYDTCYRAKEIFGVEDALLVTQNFHLPRAIFICNALGIKVNGVSADQRTYRRSVLLFWNIREIPAILNAVVDVWITKPLPVLGEPEPIFSPHDTPDSISPDS